MQRFVELVVRFKEYITLIALVVMSLSLMTYGNVAKLGGFRSLVVGGIGVLQGAFAWIPNPVALQTENKALRELNLQLSNEVVRMRQSVIENSNLRNQLDFKAKAQHPMLSAEVVGKTSVEMRNYITLNRGSKDGIQEGMPVITDAGVVGLVISTSKNYCLVQDLINRDSRVSAKVQRTRYDGIVAWDGSDHLVMKNVPKSTDVQAGDVIITSEYSRRYLPDLILGRVTDVNNDGNSVFRKILIQPAVNYSTIEQCFIILNVPHPERIQLEKDLEQKLMKKAGGK